MAKSTSASIGGVSRPPLERMQRIHGWLKKATEMKNPINCRQMAEKLEVSPKTVQRDIDFMRDRLGLPIEYAPADFGFCYTEPVANFPAVQVSEGELVALFVAEKALAQYRGTPFEKPLHAAFQKLTAGLDARISFSWQDLDAAISFRSIGATVADLELFETVSGTVLRSEELEFEYKGLGKTRHEPRRVQPYHLGWIEGQWYLFAFDLDRRQMRTFALGRMRQARGTGKRFTRPADFSVTRHLQNSFGVFSGGGTAQEVRIRFDRFAAQLVRERQWHPTQKLHDLSNGELELTLKLGNLPEVFRWVLSWGDHARVLAPQQLRQEILNTARKLAASYA